MIVKKSGRERKAKEDKEQSLPVVKELLLQGLQYVLSESLPMKIKVLEYHFKNTEAKSSLRLERANQLLAECFSNIATDANRNDNGVPPLPPVFGDVEDGLVDTSSGPGSPELRLNETVLAVVFDDQIKDR